MKTAAKTTLNSIEEMLHEVNTLVAGKENYVNFFMVRNNLNFTYQSDSYVEIMDISTTIGARNSFWIADINF